LPTSVSRCASPTGLSPTRAEITPDGVTVTEVWMTREQWERWFSASVRPHLPADAPEPTVTELHNALGR